ncbi:unnamed protein product [Kluyveromyces dobzhanskii CBS 2104]|uniref:WGS project CCBQ000000000 data, contig 00015 n=1 Tax=Kluyveromyces dobzhanskii CBS 2104 TaxID=1427455 RepID=A0A0A8L976_9SACH|nr:unnamed protein product [Kluyveromyces dobzhanskii CBS 2104]
MLERDYKDENDQEMLGDDSGSHVSMSSCNNVDYDDYDDAGLEQHAVEPQNLYTEHVEKGNADKKLDVSESNTHLSLMNSAKSDTYFNGVPYTRFSKNDKLLLVAICALSGFYSTIAQTIYFPALSIIEEEFNVSEGLVNVTVVVYSLCQGIFPVIMGGLADRLGRRPVALFCIMVYFCACIGIACCRTFGEMIFLRCLQGGGISPIIAINNGLMGDITVKSERGGYVGLTSGFQVLGSALGGLLGALFTARWGWRSIFWFLATGSGVTLFFVVIALPETKRSVVGNGSIKPALLVNRSLLLSLPYYRKKLHLDNPDYETKTVNATYDPTVPFKILIRPELISLLVVQGLQFTTWICHMTTLSQRLKSDYGLSMVTIGVCYLPAGICTLISVVSAGRILNWNYRRRFAQHKLLINSERERLLAENNNDRQLVQSIMENDIKYKFDLFKTRLDYAFIPILVSNAGFVAYGWCIETKQNLAAVLIMSGLASLMCNCMISISNTVVVDLFPERASTAAGCVNFVRCTFTAIVVAALAKMNSSMTVGGTFTFLAAFACVCATLLVIPLKYGLRLQLARERRQAQKASDTKTFDENNIDPDDSEEERELSDLRREATLHSNASAI